MMRFAPDIVARLDELADLTSEPGRITRLYLTPSHRAAAERVMDWMRAAGMTARIDAIGSVVGRLAGSDPGAPVLLLGSHIDTVRDAGRYDGTLGVVTALAVVERLHRTGGHLPFAIEIVAFGDEEGVRFPSTLAGSRALAGRFDAAILDERDGCGVTRRAALVAFGCDPTAIAAEARAAAQVLGYVEVHIEQGPVLETLGLPVAVVTAINGATRGMVTVTGDSAHAGTVPMALRRDALAAAAEQMLAIERRATAAADLVATVGRLEIPNAAGNTVPGRVRFSLDIRSPSDAVRAAAVADCVGLIEAIAARRRVQAAVALTYDAPASVCDPALTDGLAAAIAARGVPVHRMPSGAGHDAMAFRERWPFTMLFVRCRGGVSHNPAEYADPADIEMAARVLETFILSQADRWPPIDHAVPVTQT